MNISLRTTLTLQSTDRLDKPASQRIMQLN